MITISNTVEKILLDDGFAIEAMQRGLLNISGYAKEIHKTVEAKTMKPVALGTIIVALSRITDKIQKQPAFTPQIKILSLSVTSALSEITYEKIEQAITKLSALSNTLMGGKEFFTITEGLHEITIICSEDVKEKIKRHFEIKPKAVINDLVAVSVRFSPDYTIIPNTIYSLVGSLAIKRINIVEIISTYTELSFIVYQNDMERTIHALDTYSKK